ncbi:MAG TPA: hypothetical protein PKG48_12015, partial [Bacteroidales bacterium]|nr:hypothetical protein [Bacteroidales bacterium]
MHTLKFSILLPLLLFFPVLLLSQTNTDFWFAAPEVTSGHGDNPIYLRLTSFSEPATVTVSEPANAANFATQTFTLASNSTYTLNLTASKDQVESKPPNSILDLGLHIHSSAPITAYYEEASTNNPEIFILKGNNAMGTSFVIPSQNVLYNHAPLNPSAYNSFDIVATENNTTVTITPRNAIVGHAAGVPFDIILNQGQVYSAQATGQTGASHLQGSIVTSDKPICITVKDDSDQYSGQACYDLTGDQIVPVNIVGTQYIVVRGYSNSTMNDWAFVTATADGTDVSVNGTAVSTLNKGETFNYPLQSSDLFSYIESNHPVSVWHLTGYNCEAGSAQLPPMLCTGSTQVAFTRSTQYSFEMIILTRDGAQGSFSVDGNATLVLPTMFSPVTANPNFVYARIEFPVSTLPVGAHILSNSANVFHLGIIHTYDPSQSGCSYGYFSDFASLNLGPDLSVCPGASATFNAGPNRQNYQWFFNGLPYASGVQTITVTDTGSYSVTVDDHGCLLSDTIHLGNLTAPDPVLSGVTSFCQGESHTLTVNGSYPGYLWNTGATTGSVPVTTGGTYSVTVTDEAGCTGSTSAEVTVHSLPPVSLVQPAPTCLNTAPYPLSGGAPSGGIYGGFGVDPLNSYFSPSSGAGPHTITYTFTDAFGCTNADTNVLVVNDIPSV